MTFELPELTTNIARAILLDLASGGYNKGWSWWAYDASEKYEVGSLTITLVENERLGDSDYSFNEDRDVLLVWSIEGPWEGERFFTMKGTATSYSTNWDGTFREARAKTKTVVVYE